MDDEKAVDDLAPDEALAEIDETLDRQAALRSRTEGLTWMIWGLVTAGWTLSYDAIAWIGRPDAPAWAFDLAWLPWILAGGLVTTALWRTAALTDPRLEDERPAGPLVVAGWTAFVIATWTLLYFGVVGGLGFPGTADTMGLIVLGIAWASFGWLRPVRLTDRGSRVSVIVGLVLLAAGLLTAFALGNGHPSANAIATPIATVVGGGAPLAGGLWQALRG